MVVKIPEGESISRKDCFVHTMYKAKSPEAIRQAKQFDTETVKINCKYVTRLVDSNL